MKRSPGPTPCSPLSISSAASAAVELLLTRRAMRAVSASRGRCTPGRSTSTSWQSPLWCTPRIARRVVCGRSETIATFSPTTALMNVDLPTLGRPASATKPLRVTSAPREQLALEREHLAVVGLVVHAEQMQHPVHDRLAQVDGVLGADHDVAELARSGAGRASAPSIGNDSTSVGLGLPRCSRLSSAIRSRVDELDRHCPSLDAGARPAPARTGARPRRAGGAPRASSRRTTSTSIIARQALRTQRGARSPRRRRARALGVHVVGLDDPLHELVAHDVLAAEADELDALDPVEDVADDDQPRLLLARQVDLRDVAGHDHPRAEAEAREEHLHLLGRRVLRLVEDHERVVQRAPAHERQRRDLDHAALDVLGDLLGVEHVVQGVEQRPQVGIDLGHQVARQEAQPLARLDRGARQDDAVDLVAESAAAAIATARNVLPVPAGPTPKVIVFLRIEST